ncbi:MAG: hypothetical protein E4H02_09990 [Lentisphaerales bacterium]|jgi:hypothetical protein|nr:MAG: hypothetical protein E4H02_09990 [Lentisphaerales bacterium]
MMNLLGTALGAWRRRWRVRVLLLAILIAAVAGAIPTSGLWSAWWHHVLYWEKPLPSSQHFFACIRDADRLVVRDGGFNCCTSVRRNSVLFTITDPAELGNLRTHIQFVPFTNELTGGCLCCGWPGLDWYKGRSRLALTSVQHGHAIRWKQFGTSGLGPFRHGGDVPLTIESTIWLTKWLRDHGVTNDADYSEERIVRLQGIANKTFEAIGTNAPKPQG